ncbi:MAG: DUF3237 domain-containing protein [Proteobacteria bacterium]|nr:DUF3237 domain-containing protein [Pseudomonadota bacterium]
MDLKYEYLCDIEADLEEAIPIGATPHGVRMILGIKGGTVSGPKLNGEILPSGADWVLMRPDGALELDVRAAMRTDDGELIYTYYRGVIEVDPTVYERIQNGEDVDPSEYYFRTTPVYETGSEKYGWLNRIVAVGVGRLHPSKVFYKIFRIL